MMFENKLELNFIVHVKLLTDSAWEEMGIVTGQGLVLCSTARARGKDCTIL